MAERDRPGSLPQSPPAFFTDAVANPAEANLFAGLFLITAGHQFTIGQLGAFGNDDQRELFSALLAADDRLADAFEGPGDFRDENHVATAGDPGVNRDPAGVSPHQFEHHDRSEER